MTDQDHSYYRPRSPDFSTFQSPISPPIPPPAPVFHPLPPLYQFGTPLAHRASYDASPFFPPQYQQPPAPPTRVPQHYHLDPDMARRSSRIAQAAEVAPLPPAKYVDPVVEEEPPEEIEEVEEEVVEEPPQPAPPAPVEVKTKFPVARIKRIMQADEDVGKVAQVTPIAVCMYSHPLSGNPPPYTGCS